MSRKQPEKNDMRDYAVLGLAGVSLVAFFGISVYLYSQNKENKERIDKMESENIPKRLGAIEKGANSLTMDIEGDKKNTKRKRKHKRRTNRETGSQGLGYQKSENIIEKRKDPRPNQRRDELPSDSSSGSSEIFDW